MSNARKLDQAEAELVRVTATLALMLREELEKQGQDLQSGTLRIHHKSRYWQEAGKVNLVLKREPGMVRVELLERFPLPATESVPITQANVAADQLEQDRRRANDYSVVRSETQVCLREIRNLVEHGLGIRSQNWEALHNQVAETNSLLRAIFDSVRGPVATPDNVKANKAPAGESAVSAYQAQLRILFPFLNEHEIQNYDQLFRNKNKYHLVASSTTTNDERDFNVCFPQVGEFASTEVLDWDMPAKNAHFVVTAMNAYIESQDAKSAAFRRNTPE